MDQVAAGGPPETKAIVVTVVVQFGSRPSINSENFNSTSRLPSTSQQRIRSCVLSEHRHPCSHGHCQVGQHRTPTGSCCKESFKIGLVLIHLKNVSHVDAQVQCPVGLGSSCFVELPDVTACAFFLPYALTCSVRKAETPS